MHSENLQRSILKACSENDVDLYCPALNDSGIGLQLWSFLQENDINVDTFLDLKDIISKCWDAKRTGVAIVGGGVPKNFILQSHLQLHFGISFIIPNPSMTHQQITIF